MKRVIICLMLLSVMLTGVVSVHAAEPEMTVQIIASQTQVQVGDRVEYTVLATGSGVVAMQFNLQLPEGLSYVPNSGRTPERLAQKLGVPAADWTEQSKMFTFYNDVGITFAKGTEILRFSCVAEREGQWDVQLYELLPFNEQFEEFPAKLQVQTVKVGGETKLPVPAETEPSTTVGAVPSEPEQQLPQQTEPQQTEPQQTEQQVTDAVELVTEPESPEDDQQISQEQAQNTVPESEKPTLEQKPTKTGAWKMITALSLGGIILVSVAAVLWSKLRKNSKDED